MTQPAKSREPSMEEILASIRRIIAEEEPAQDPHESPHENPYESPYGRRDESPASEPVAPPPPAAPPSAMPPPMAPRVTPAPTLAIKEELDAMLAQLQATSGQAAAAEGPAAGARDASERTAAPGPVFEPSASASAARAIEQRPALEAGERGLVSAATSAAVDSAFGALARSVELRNSRTLEEVVGEMLRPMLKAWLDDNLPGMVERLVRAEIERISRASSE
jgi:cell pole-organizing protein PopZ